MPQPLFNTKKVAQLLVEGMLYIPKGLVLPCMRFLDDTRELLLHDQIACAYCEKKLLLPKASCNKFSNWANEWFNALYNALYKINLKGVTLFAKLFKLFPPSIIERLNTRLLKVEKKIRKPLASVRQFFLINHYTIVWYGVGILSLFAAAFVWGFGIIPEVYVFCLASSWGGRIINHGANLLIFRRFSEEWLFLKDLKDFFLGKTPSLKTDKEIKALLKKLIIELSLITMLGRFYQFIGYCFQAFFTWMFIYILVKSAAEEAPLVLHDLEENLSKSPKANRQHTMKNALWVISYKLFKSAGSTRAQEEYELLHQQSHRIPKESPNNNPLSDPPCAPTPILFYKKQAYQN